MYKSKVRNTVLRRLFEGKCQKKKLNSVKQNKRYTSPTTSHGESYESPDSMSKEIIGPRFDVREVFNGNLLTSTELGRDPLRGLTVVKIFSELVDEPSLN